MNKFDLNKKNALTKLDKSKKGDIDKDLIPLLNEINKKKDFFTTSSCSGRISLLAKQGRKDKCDWFFVSHSIVKSFTKLKNSLQIETKKDVWFKQEAFIIHIACRNLSDAETLLKISKNIGVKRSGIISTKKDKVMVEIVGNENLESLIAKKGKLLVDEKYLKVLLKEANIKLKSTKNKIKKFYKEIKRV